MNHKSEGDSEKRRASRRDNAQHWYLLLTTGFLVGRGKVLSNHHQPKITMSRRCGKVIAESAEEDIRRERS